MPDVTISLSIIPLVALIVGGLALFLFGINSLSSDLKLLADGETFRRLISKATSNKIKSCAIGTGFTALIQSSGGTYALSIGLVKAGALEYENAIAIVIGANLGTCITSFLISIPGISQFMPFVAFAAAFAMMVVHKRKAQQWSRIAFSFSLVFFGVWLMESFGGSLIEGKEWFSTFFIFLNNHPWLGLLFGTAITLLFQSCSAIIGIIQGVFAAMATIPSSPISLFGVLPIIIGSNIGAAIPAILAAFGGNPTAKRVAFINTLMKIVGALIFMGILYGIGDNLNNIPITWQPKFQLALGHLFFNVMCVIIFLPLVKPLCWLGSKVFPDDPKLGEKIEFKELDTQVIKNFPSTGLSLAAALSDKMFKYVLTMFEKLEDYRKEPNEELKEYISNLERAVDNIDRHLADFLLNAETGELSRVDLKRHGRIMRGIKDIERIGDYGESLLTFYSNISDNKNKFDRIQNKEISDAHNMALDIIKKTLDVYQFSDAQLALDVIKERREYIAKLEEYQEAYFVRETNKNGGTNNYIALIYVDILNNYERVYSHCANIAKLFNSDKDINRYAKSDKTKFTNMSIRY